MANDNCLEHTSNNVNFTEDQLLGVFQLTLKGVALLWWNNLNDDIKDTNRGGVILWQNPGANLPSRQVCVSALIWIPHLVISGLKTNSNFQCKTNLTGMSTARVCNSASPQCAGWQIYNLQSEQHDKKRRLVGSCLRSNVYWTMHICCYKIWSNTVIYISFCASAILLWSCYWLKGCWDGRWLTVIYETVHLNVRESDA